MSWVGLTYSVAREQARGWVGCYTGTVGEEARLHGDAFFRYRL